MKRVSPNERANPSTSPIIVSHAPCSSTNLRNLVSDHLLLLLRVADQARSHGHGKDVILLKAWVSVGEVSQAD
jgi:hypothetical protein